MAGQIVYADLNIVPKESRGKRRSLPQPGASVCPRWHRTALWLGWSSSLVLGAAVLALGSWGESLAPAFPASAGFGSGIPPAFRGTGVTVRRNCWKTWIFLEGTRLHYLQSEKPGNVTDGRGDVAPVDCRDVTPADCTDAVARDCQHLREALCPPQEQDPAVRLMRPYRCSIHVSAEGDGCQLCPPGWTRRGRKCYWVADKTQSWDKSRENCTSRDAELLMPEDCDELEFVKDIAKKPSKYFWINLSSLDQSRILLSGSCLDQSGRQRISEFGDEDALPHLLPWDWRARSRRSSESFVAGAESRGGWSVRVAAALRPPWLAAILEVRTVPGGTVPELQ
ncbi:uncharacterized protein [Apteryx mantelli]|uniref:C-type lectin domain-containing protein n=1 Tax=Apteryx mantelli TaxID=2696672 RepID=A0ABM4FXN7_9AVES